MTITHEKLKYTCELRGRIGWQNLRADEFTDEGPYIITGMHFADGRVEWERCYHVSNERYELDANIHVQPGDLLITKDGSIGKLAYIDSMPGPACLNSHLLLIRPKGDSISTLFLYYLLQSDEFQRYVLDEQSGTTFYGISQESIANFKARFPSSLVDQIAIARQIETKRSAIDRLIEQKERLVALLIEERLALINQTVTTGVDRNALMQQTGIPWIGKIPAHWGTIRLRHLSPRIGVGLVINPSTYTTTEGVPFIFGSNITESGFDLDGVRMISPVDSQSLPASLLHQGDLVTVRVGYPGVTAVVPSELEGANCASVMIIRQGPKFNSDWLCHVMNSRVGRHQVERVQYGAAQEQFNISHAVDFRVPLPPLAEQAQIAEFLTTNAAQLGAAVQSNQRSISLLREYRSALITAAVTGQLDIREHEKKMEALA